MRVEFSHELLNVVPDNTISNFTLIYKYLQSNMDCVCSLIFQNKYGDRYIHFL